MLIQDLDVYKKAHQITLSVYAVTEKFPKSEIFGLVSQMRRAAVSIASNLAEGAARKTSGETIHFIGISRGSAAELRYQITLARDLKFIAQNTAEELLKQMDSILQMLSGLMRNTRATYIE